MVSEKGSEPVSKVLCTEKVSVQVSFYILGIIIHCHGRGFQQCFIKMTLRPIFLNQTLRQSAVKVLRCESIKKVFGSSASGECLDFHFLLAASNCAGSTLSPRLAQPSPDPTTPNPGFLACRRQRSTGSELQYVKVFKQRKNAASNLNAPIKIVCF